MSKFILKIACQLLVALSIVFVLEGYWLIYLFLWTLGWVLYGELINSKEK